MPVEEDVEGLLPQFAVECWVPICRTCIEGLETKTIGILWVNPATCACCGALEEAARPWRERDLPELKKLRGIEPKIVRHRYCVFHGSFHCVLCPGDSEGIP